MGFHNIYVCKGITMSTEFSPCQCFKQSQKVRVRWEGIVKENKKQHKTNTQNKKDKIFRIHQSDLKTDAKKPPHHIPTSKSYPNEMSTVPGFKNGHKNSKHLRSKMLDSDNIVVQIRSNSESKEAFIYLQILLVFLILCIFWFIYIIFLERKRFFDIIQSLKEKSKAKYSIHKLSDVLESTCSKPNNQIKKGNRNKKNQILNHLFK